MNAPSGPEAKRLRHCRSRQVIAALIAVAALIGIASPASADIIQISGTGLVRHCPCQFDPADSAVVADGVLQPQDSGALYFVPVEFTKSGVKVCSFSMIYRDVNNADTMTATLKRKKFAVGGDAFQTPVVMARVKSASGVVDTVRRARKTNIKQAKINIANSFYYVEVDAPTVNLEILGIQIKVKKTC